MRRILLSLLISLSAMTAYSQFTWVRPLTISTRELAPNGYWHTMGELYFTKHPDATVFLIAPSFHPESILFIEDDMLTVVDLEYQFWTYIRTPKTKEELEKRRKELLEFIKERKEQLNEAIMEQEEDDDPDELQMYKKSLAKAKATYKSMKKTKMIPPKAHEKSLKVDSVLCDRLRDLLEVATETAKDERDWILDGVNYSIIPSYKMRVGGMKAGKLHSPLGGPELHLVEIMTDVADKVRTKSSEDINNILPKIKTTFNEFFEALDADNSFRKCFERKH